MTKLERSALPRLPSFSSLALLIVAGCGAAKSVPASTMARPTEVTEAPSMAAQAESGGFSAVNTDRALNTVSHVRTWAEDLLDTSSDFRSEVYRLGGYVVNERIDYGDGLRAMKASLPSRAPGGERNKAIFAVSLPIEELPRLLDWLRGHSRIVEQYVSAVRDSALPTPAAIAASEQGLRRAALEERLAALVAQLSLASASEQERSELERERESIEAELVQLAHIAVAATEPAVKYTTLNVYIEADMPQARFAAARIVPTLRATLLATDVLAKRSERDIRVGAAIGVALPDAGPGGFLPSPILEVAGYPATGDSDASIIATMGIGQYARSTGDGRRRWLNPFAGVRLGYAYVDSSAAIISGELGLELYKSGGVALSGSLRPSALIGKDSQVLLETGGSLSIAF